MYGWTPLHRAARQGHEEVAAALFTAGAVVDCATVSHETPLALGIGAILEWAGRAGKLQEHHQSPAHLVRGHPNWLEAKTRPIWLVDSALVLC